MTAVGGDTTVGAATTELAVAFPAALLIIVLAFQFALYLHAAQIVEAAAQDAVDAAQGQTAGAEAGEAAARRLLAHLGAVRNATVEVDRSAVAVTARVTGSAQRLVPGIGVAVAATAQGPVERFVPEGGR